MRKQFVGDKIKVVVESMRGDAKLTQAMLPNDHATLDQIPFFMPGHRLEITNRLLNMDRDPDNKWLKYPLFLLKLDLSEDVVNEAIVNCTINMWIVTFTKRGYNSEERVENVFKPILYPLYDLFFEKLYDSGLFSWPQAGLVLPKHTAIDRPFWGTIEPDKNIALTLNDPLDAIEISNLKLNTKPVC